MLCRMVRQLTMAQKTKVKSIKPAVMSFVRLDTHAFVTGIHNVSVLVAQPPQVFCRSTAFRHCSLSDT